jgi:olefin beta-lactone synthetase
LASEYSVTRDIRLVLFHPSLPVDVRHNSKINRELLAEWAVTEIGKHKFHSSANPHHRSSKS